MSNISKTISYFKRNGVVNTAYAVVERLKDKKGVPYEFVPVSEETLESQKNASKNPLILFSILVPAYKTVPKYLRELVDCCLSQSYSNFELIIADASPDDSVKSVLDEYEDDRIRYIKLTENGGIAANTNAAIEAARGDYCALLDHDDLLTRDALFEMAAHILKHKVSGNVPMFLYSDEDKCNGDATAFYDPNIKPRFNLDYLYSNNYICHLAVIETHLLKKLKLRPEFDGAQDYDLFLRIAKEVDDETKIHHVAKVLYHWRCHEQSTAANPNSKDYAYEAGRRALEEVTGVATSHLMHKGFYHVDYKENLFNLREDVGAVGTVIVGKGKILGGVYNENGNCPFFGLNKHFSGGILHRAHCTMDVYALDIRNMQVRPELAALRAEALYGYQLDGDLKKWNEYFAKVAHRRGYKLLFDPYLEAGLPYGGINMRYDNILPVSVVIPNYNGKDYLRDCLNSFALCVKRPYEIIVVDNGSTDGSVEMLKEDFPFVKIIHHNENLGFVGAANHGIIVTTMAYVFLLNNDTKISPDTVGKLYDAIKDREDVFSIQALMLKMDDPETIDNAGDYYNILGYARGSLVGKSRFKATSRGMVRVFSCCGGAVLYRRKILEEIGLFDDVHFAYLEDVDLGYRANIMGYKNLICPDALVWHKGSAVSGSRHNAFKVSLSAQNSVLLAVKNMPLLQYVCNLPFLLLGVLIKFGFFLLKGLGGAYLRGIFKGIGLAFSKKERKKHVKFRFKNMGRYFYIQMWLFGALLK